MTTGLKRYYGSGYLHFITSSCYERRPFLRSPESRDTFLAIFEEVRQRYQFIVKGYVVMPEHVHLLISEPESGDPSLVMQVLKHRSAIALIRDLHINTNHIWQKRFYDFVVSTPEKRAEKLNYVHDNPVRRGLVEDAEQWRWSSARYYALGEIGPVMIDEKKLMGEIWKDKSA